MVDQADLSAKYNQLDRQRDWLDGTAIQTSLMGQLDRPIRKTSYIEHRDKQARPTSQTEQLDRPARRTG